MIERPAGQENKEVSKIEVVESLKQNPENLLLLNEFLNQREALVTTSKEALALNIEVAEIYRDSGLFEIAKEAFIQAADQALQEQDDRLYEQLVAEADKIRI